MYEIMQTIIQALANTIFVSILEESFIVAFSLMLLKKFDALEFNKGINVKRFLGAILIPAVFTNASRQFGVQDNFVLLIGVLSVYGALVLIYKIHSPKKLLGAFISILTAIVTFMAIELSYVPLLLRLLNTTVEEVNSSVLNNFLLSIPERTIEAVIIWAMWKKRFNILKVDVVKVITNSRVLSILSIVLLGMNVFMLGLSGKYVIFDRYLSGFPISVQMVFIVGTLILPIFNMVILYAIIYNLKYKEGYRKLFRRDNINSLVSILEESIQEGDYRMVRMALDDMKNLN